MSIRILTLMQSSPGMPSHLQCVDTPNAVFHPHASLSSGVPSTRSSSPTPASPSSPALDAVIDITSSHSIPFSHPSTFSGKSSPL